MQYHTGKTYGNSGYKVIGYTQYGCSDIATTMVRVIQPMTVQARTLDTLCYGDTKRLVVSGAEQYIWRQDQGSALTAANVTVARPLGDHHLPGDRKRCIQLFQGYYRDQTGSR
jgi:hypothetical protein